MRTLLERFQAWLETLTDTQKRLLLAAGLLLVAVVIGFIIYWVFFRSFFVQTEEQVNINGQLVNVNQLPSILSAENFNVIENANNVGLPTVDIVAHGGDTLSQVIYNGNAQAATISGDGAAVQYYDATTGKFYRINANGEAEPLSDIVLKGVQNVTWSNDADKAVLELADGYKVLYDFTANKQYTLNKDMNEFDFSPTDTQISFKFTPKNQEDRWLGTANTDGSGAVGIEPLGKNEALVNAQWSPSGQSIGVLHEYVDDQRQRVVPLGFKGEDFKQFIVNGRGFDYRWTNDGQKMIYSAYSGGSNYNDSLYVVDALGDDIGKNNKLIGLNTSVDKCTFSSSGDTVYCAVPVDPPVGGGVDASILEHVPHDIYRVNLVTGVKEKIATPTDATGSTALAAPSNLMVSADDGILYYREVTTGQLRRILLK